MSLLEKFKIERGTLAPLINEPELLERTSKTTQLILDKEVPYKASINGQPVNAFVTLRQAAITRLSLIKNYKRTNPEESYWLATGVFQPVRMDIDLLIDGTRMSFSELIKNLAEEDAGKSSTSDEVTSVLQNISLNYSNGMPLYFQQFGANKEAVDEFIEIFKSHGAKLDFENRGNIVFAYDLKPLPGIPVTSFEVGTTDRSQSTRNQGFLNLVEAQFEQITRILALRKSAAIKRQQAEKSTDEAETIKLLASANLDIEMSNDARANWAGSQRRIELLKNGSTVTKDQYDLVNLPCGRFTIATNSSEHKIDFWSNNKNKSINPPAVKNDSATEPF